MQTQVIDVLERYYFFSRLDKKNPFYDLKKENYLRSKEMYFSNKIQMNTLPLRATIQSTDFCNLNCIMCQIHSHEEEHSLKQMKKSDFDIIVERIFPTLMEVHPTNIGEPLVSPWFDYLCEKCSEYGVLLDITSNGTLLTLDKINKIVPNLLDIKISFDGYKKQTFERIRKGADYNLVLGNIKNLIKIKNERNPMATVTLQMTLFSFNYNELLDLVCLAKDIGINKVKAYHLFSYSMEMDEYSLVNHLEDFEKVRKDVLKLAKELEINVDIAEPESHNIESDVKHLVKQKCRLPWAECFIDYDGCVYPCHTHNHLPYGNIFTQDMRDVWCSDYAMSLRKGLVYDNIENSICNKCGNLFVRTDRNQGVPYNMDDYLFVKTGDNNINWGKRCKQFLLNR